MEYLTLVSQSYNHDQTNFLSKTAERIVFRPIGLPIKPPFDEFTSNCQRFTAQEETDIFTALHFVKFKINTAKRKTKKWPVLYYAIRNRVISANMGLVTVCIKRSKMTYDHDTMHSEGYEALLRAADGFDPWRGVKFSTYACWAILRNFTRPLRKKSITISEADLNQLPVNKETQDDSGIYIELINKMIEGNKMSDTEKKIIIQRFGLNGNTPQTLKEVGKELDYSPERVRQIQLLTINKMRGILYSSKLFV